MVVQMCIKRVLLLVLSVILVVTLGGASQEEDFLASLIDSGHINQDEAELVWLNCRTELIHAKEAVEDEAISSIRQSTKTDIQEFENPLHPLAKQTLLDCLQRNNLEFIVSGEEKGSKPWYVWFLELLFARFDTPKRRELAQSSGEAPAPSPALAPSPTISDSPPPASSPAPLFFQQFNNSSPQTAASGPSGSDALSNNRSSNHRTVVVAVSVTAAVTFLLVSLLFLCYYKVCKNGLRKGQNDERPLLCLSLSDYSIGNTLNNEKSDSHSLKLQSGGNYFMEPQASYNSEINVPLGSVSNAAVPSINVSAPEHLGIAGLPPLKPPPGRVNPPLPPAKAAPPAKTGPLPPTPPAKPAPAAPPPPVNTASPPPPPLPRRPSIGGSRSSPPGPPPPPPPVPSGKAGPPPPPPPVPSGKAGPRPPPPPAPMGLKPPQQSHIRQSQSSSSAADEGVADGQKTKLKPFFWDKVLANPDHSMVWHQIKSGSFQFNEEMIESLFGYAPANKNKETKKDSTSQDASNQYIQIIDQKKAQNLAILLKALNVTTEEVCDALKEGNELPAELLQTLLKMAPTSEEELKLRLYNGELSRLGNAERFLKVLVDFPFAYKRLESLLFMCTLQEETSMIKESFATLEAACTELRKSRLFLKLLEAVLKTGNRMNDGTYRGGAQAFKLDTLLKLSDVKGTDGKTTLLHFVVQEIIRSEGLRAARAARESQSTSSIKSDDSPQDTLQDSEEYHRSLGLQVVSGLGNELEHVKNAAVLDADSLTGTVSNLGHSLVKAKNFLTSVKDQVDEDDRFFQTLKNFVQNAEVDVTWLLEEEKRIMSLVKSTGDYFHGNAGKDEGLRLFVIVRDFLIILDKVCREVGAARLKPKETPRKENITVVPSPEPNQFPPSDPRHKLFPAISDRRYDSSTSDDES